LVFNLRRFILQVLMGALVITLLGSQAYTPANAATQATLLFNPAADAFVRAAYPNRTAGTGLGLRARGVPVVNSYLRFTVSGLSGISITQVLLRLYMTSTSSNRLQARVVSNNAWGETTIAYDTAPATGSLISTSAAPVSGKWLNIDVSSYVKSAGTYSFAITSNSLSAITFASRETGATSPRLVVNPGTSTSSTPSAIKHVFVIVMENHSYSEVWNRGTTPYTTQLGTTYARATNYHAIGHPSLPNYLEMYGGSRYGISTDCSPSSSCHVNARNLADNLDAKGLKWKAYMDSMPAPCYIKTSGEYAPKHNPLVYFDDIRTNSARCSSHVVSFSALAGDLSALSTTPNYAFISPNLCNNMHSCSISTGDNWLRGHVPAILNSAACKVDTCLVMLTWDEDDGSSSNHVLTIFAGSGAKAGASSSASYSHYSLLRTVEAIFGLPTQTSNDAGASVMRDMLR
jgi:phosphatidylinositol-3-phosphatase